MARIPQGEGPQVRFPGGGSPGQLSPSAPAAAAIAGGPAQKIGGGGFEQIGASLFDIAKSISDREAQSARLAEERAQDEFLLEQTRDLNERTENAPPGAKGLANQFLVDYDDKVRTRLESVPEVVREWAATRYADSRRRLGLEAMKVERDAQTVERTDNFNASVDLKGNRVRVNPAELDTALAEADDMLNNAGLPPRVVPGLRRNMQNRLVGMYYQSLNESDPRRALRELQEGKHDTLLHGPVKDALMDGSNRAIAVLDAKAEQARREAIKEAKERRRDAQADYDFVISDTIAAGRVGAPPHPDYSEKMVRDLYRDRPRHAEQVIRSVRIARGSGAAAAELATTTAAEDAALEADIAARRGGGGVIEAGNIDVSARPRVKNADNTVSTLKSINFEEDGRHVLVPTLDPEGKQLSDDEAIKRYHDTGEHLGVFDSQERARAAGEHLSATQGGQTPDAVQHQIDTVRLQTLARKRKAIAEDPAGYAISHRPDLHREMNDPSADVRAKAVHKLMQAQADYGVPEYSRAVLSKAQAASIVAEVQKDRDNPAAVQQKMQNLQQKFGGYWPRVFRQLTDAKLDGAAIVLGSLDREQDAVVAQESAVALQTPKAELEASLQPDVKPDQIRKAVQSELNDYFKTLTSGGAGFTRVAQVSEAVTRLAMARNARGMPLNDAARSAADDIINNRHDYAETYRTPKGLGGMIERYADWTTRNLKPEDLAPLRIGVDEAPMTEAQRAALQLDAVKHGVWLNDREGDGIFLVYASTRQQVRRKDGSPVHFKFAEAVEKGGPPLPVAPLAEGESPGGKAGAAHMRYLQKLNELQRGEDAEAPPPAKLPDRRPPSSRQPPAPTLKTLPERGEVETKEVTPQGATIITRKGR